MHVAAGENYGMGKKPCKWVSQEILELMKLLENDHKGKYVDWEKQLHRQIRAEIKKERRNLLNNELAGGGWRAIKNTLKKSPTRKPMQVKRNR